MSSTHGASLSSSPHPNAMRKSTSIRIDPFYPDDTQDSYLLLNPPSKGHLVSTTSAIFPYLRKLDIRDELSSPKPQQKKALLTLKLSSTSFLDTDVNDGLSNDPLYKFKTIDMCTTLMRYDPWDGSTKIAEIRWPRQTPVKAKGKENMQDVFIRMNGHTKPVESFLKFVTLSAYVYYSLPTNVLTLTVKPPKQSQFLNSRLSPHL